MVVYPPSSERELCDRAAWLSGRTIGELARALGAPIPAAGARGKGKMGALVEKALGAEAGSASVPDFPRLGIELKTIPVDGAGTPRESTFICSIAIASADRIDWITSAARAKLCQVLFVPILVGDDEPVESRRIGRSFLWRPTAEQEAILRDDFELAMGAIGAGRVEALTARSGRWLQVRPKAATGRVRTFSFGPEGEWIATVPRGFYLRASFTRALLQDPSAVPD
ncbi:MAG TPA: DNA mismatch repair endonuclease MutH [Polyangiaceae bacterium]|nr:DNA mismatch repair endonuclease MutH [Polyangiaceae bacterium]